MKSLPLRTILLLLGGCGSVPAPPVEETIAVPGTNIRLDMVFVPGRADLRPFWISKREVTWGEFDRFYQSPEEQGVDGVTRPSSGKNYLQLSGLPAESMQEERPVTNLRFHSALCYCEWLSRKTGIIFRLPTEKEWEASPGRAKIWEYCLESESPPDFGPVLRGEGRRTIPPEWDQADPNRPVSTWWFRTGHSQGFRVVRVPGGDGRASSAKTLEVTGLKGEERTVRVGRSVALYMRVSGQVRNAGDRAVEELLLKVYYLDPAGKPHLEDVTNNLTRRATFNVCAPALRNSAHPGPQARPLAPGERRSFAVDLPLSMDADADVQTEKFGASVVHLLYAGD
jgi:hypothetical protein